MLSEVVHLFAPTSLLQSLTDTKISKLIHNTSIMCFSVRSLNLLSMILSTSPTQFKVLTTLQLKLKGFKSKN